MTAIDFIILSIVLGVMFGTSGCSHSMLVKDCAQVEGQDYYKCKTLKPWE